MLISSPHSCSLADLHLAGRSYPVRLYGGEHLPGPVVAFDSETALIQDRTIPALALASVYADTGDAWIIPPEQLATFVQAHQDLHWIAHNASFDFWVVEQFLRKTSQEQARAAWWAIADQGRLHDTMILERLIALAETDEHPGSYQSLDKLAQQVGIRLDKQDPYRLRYAELIGLPSEVWSCFDPGWFEYAAADAIATWHVWQQLQKEAELLQPSPGDLLPGAEDRWGLLTETLQVRGAIALEAISRQGVQVDLEQVQRVQADISAAVAEQSAVLEGLGQQLGEPELFKRYKRSGELYYTAAGVPRKNAKACKRILARLAKESQLRPRHNKDGLVTDSVAYWQQHSDVHPFVSTYCIWSAQAKLAQFFSRLQAERIYPRYSPLVRTGRTSCSNPNLQQLPRSSSFREMICAAPGHVLLAIDYSTLELRTLAQHCLHRYGSSALAEVFRAGGDPHQHTAARLQGPTLEQFNELPAADRKQARQRAKAVNFGVPGGLGAVALQAYAKAAYQADMDVEQARQFRRTLIAEVYPELSQLLSEDRWAVLAANLCASRAAVWAALPDRGLFPILWQVLAGTDEEHSPEQQEFLWGVLEKLNRNPDLQQRLQRRQPSELLARQVLFGHASTLSGRVRGHVRFTARCNTPFQGLAADGAKLALFELVRLGYQVVGFVHDEVLIELPKGWDMDRAYRHVEQILCQTMQQLTPDIPITCEGLVADRWYKGVDGNQRDTQGRLIPYTGKE